MKEKFQEKEVNFKMKISMLKQQIADIQEEVKESANNLSMAIETAPKPNER